MFAIVCQEIDGQGFNVGGARHGSDVMPAGDLAEAMASERTAGEVWNRSAATRSFGRFRWEKWRAVQETGGMVHGFGI